MIRCQYSCASKLREQHAGYVEASRGTVHCSAVCGRRRQQRCGGRPVTCSWTPLEQTTIGPVIRLIAGGYCSGPRMKNSYSNIVLYRYSSWTGSQCRRAWLMAIGHWHIRSLKCMPVSRARPRGIRWLQTKIRMSKESWVSVEEQMIEIAFENKELCRKGRLFLFPKIRSSWMIEGKFVGFKSQPAWSLKHYPPGLSCTQTHKILVTRSAVRSDN